MAIKVLVLGLLASSVVGQVVPKASPDTTSYWDKLAALFGEDCYIQECMKGLWMKAAVDHGWGQEGKPLIKRSVNVTAGSTSTAQSLEFSSWTDTPTVTNKVEPSFDPLRFAPSTSHVEQIAFPTAVTASSAAGQCKSRMSYVAKDGYAAGQICAGLADAKDPVKLWLDEVCNASEMDEACHGINFVSNSPGANRV